MEKLAVEIYREEGRKEKRKAAVVAGTLLFIVQYFTASTKASSVFTRMAL